MSSADSRLRAEEMEFLDLKAHNAVREGTRQGSLMRLP